MADAPRLRSVSYGGGQQSTALLILAAQGHIDYPLFLFANTGADSEYPGTLTYVEEYAKPFAREHGIKFVELHKFVRGEPETVRSKIMRPIKSQVIPVRSSADGPPMSRSCTVDFKIELISRELRDRGATAEAKASIAIGISLDEMHRANRKPRPHELIQYPLLCMDDGPRLPRPLTRSDCQRVITDAGLPIPPKSSCYFCPFHSLGEWIRLRRDEPALFADSVHIEQTISAKAGSPRYLTRFGAPLDEVVPVGVDPLDFDEPGGDCSTGGASCMT